MPAKICDISQLIDFVHGFLNLVFRKILVTQSRQGPDVIRGAGFTHCDQCYGVRYPPKLLFSFPY